ncbi:MAG TPA: hypothetical protein PLL17_08070 [Defluviitaleaceae bacterium]|nr:endolytic transglycosylase MltG [Candidatus Epulonipiscium sp.]HOQ16483.1 hypothetical protein [Defluviitaleaceae bacterium]HPT75259.1 hypothetical protein [Defluviitaleaceae bacterium]HQD51064.1 hypothetical protein [Defluviitaleaceae bacterium]
MGLSTRSFMIGLGLGIVITGITFCFIPYKSISDDEIIQKSKELGMVNPLDLSPEKFVLSQEEIIRRAKKLGMDFVKKDDNLNEKDESHEYYELDVVTIFIPQGLDSKEISSLLYENHLIDDRDAFDSYLRNNNLDRIIAYGYFDIPTKSDYKTIADIITRRSHD